MRTEEFDVFISYRRQGGELYAEFLYEKLTQMGLSVFFDHETLESGLFEDDILSALRKSHNVVFVFSPGALDRCTDENDWVRKELRFAILHGKRIIPFSIGKMNWPANMPSDIEKVCGFNGVETTEHYFTQDIEKRLLQLLNVPEGRKKVPQHKLISCVEYPKSILISRNDKIEEIHEKLEVTNHLFIFGMGGSGKSELAKAYVQKYQQFYNTVVFAHFENSLIETFIDDKKFQFAGLRRMVTDTIKMESRENYFRRKLAVLKEQADERVLIVIEDFNGGEELLDDDLRDFVSGRYRVIFLTRTDFSEYHYTVEVGEDAEHARDLFYAYYGKPKDEFRNVHVENLLKGVQYHPLTVELMAKYMRYFRVKPDVMYEAMKKQGVFALNTRLRTKQGIKGYESAFVCIKAFFQTEKLDVEEKEILFNLALMPAEGINFDLFLEWTGIENVPAIYGLNARSWLYVEEEAEMLRMHAVVREVVLFDMKPDVRLCGKLLGKADEIWREIQALIDEKRWLQAVNKLQVIKPWIRQLSGETEFIRQIYQALAQCYDAMSCYSEAYDYYALAYKDELNHIENVRESVLEVLRRLAYCLDNGPSKQHEAYGLRKKLFERAAKLYGIHSDRMLDFYEDVGNSASGLGLYQESYECRKIVSQRLEELPNEKIGRKIYAKSALANSISNLKQYPEELLLRQDVCMAVKEHFGDSHPAYAVACSNTACCLIRMGKPKEAQKLLRAARELLLNIREEDDFYVQCVSTNLGAAMCAARCDEAVSFQTRVHDMQKIIFGAAYDTTLKTLANLASAFFYSGNLEEAARREDEIAFVVPQVKDFPDPLKEKFDENRKSTRAFLDGTGDPATQRHIFTVLLQLPSIK